MRIQKDQLSFVLGENYVVSFQSKPSDHFDVVRDRIENNKGIIHERNSDYLLYRMLDAIVDNYFEVIDSNTEEIVQLESKISKSNGTESMLRVEYFKRTLMDLRKYVLPLKEIAISLENSENPLFIKETKHYFSDLKQNCVSILEEIESNKSALDGLTNLYYAVQGQNMNEIMKMLTIVSTIFIPLTFIAGVYGMNFHYMPELEMKYAYYATWGVMILIALGLLLYFKKRGWIKKR